MIPKPTDADMALILRSQVMVPTEEELTKRITEHVRATNNDERVCYGWFCYLAALVEWGLVTHQTFERLFQLIPDVNRPELDVICLGIDRLEKAKPLAAAASGANDLE